MTYPTYKTRNGRTVKAYVAECVGNTFDLGADGTVNGKSGVIGNYTTAEQAIAAAKREKVSTCTVRVTDTRAERVIYQA